MAVDLTGFDLLLALRRMDADELRLPARVLLDQLDVPRCEDCRAHHVTVWDAIVCEERMDAHRRRVAARAFRLGDPRLHPDPDEDLDDGR